LPRWGNGSFLCFVKNVWSLRDLKVLNKKPYKNLELLHGENPYILLAPDGVKHFKKTTTQRIAPEG